MLALGSRGDVQPLAVLARALAEQGIETTVLAPADTAGVAADVGARVVELDVRVSDATGKLDDPLWKFVGRTRIGQALVLDRWARASAVAVVEAVLARVDPRDTIITGVLTRHLGAALAEGLGCRTAMVVYTGMVPTMHRESFYMPEHFTGFGPYDRAGLRTNWRLAGNLSRHAGAEARRRLALPQLGLNPRTAAADRHPTILAVSPTLVPPAPDWPAHAHQTGWLAPPEDAYDPPTDLATFLSADKPPVYVGFGSMGTVRAGLDALESAAETVGVRVVTPAIGQPPGVHSDRVLLLPPVPHSWLFPRTAGVLHHGGAGTTQAALAAGVPSAAAPYAVDQPYHGARLHALGVGPAPMPAIRLGREGLTKMLGALTSGRHAARAAELGTIVRAEDGVARTIKTLGRLGLLSS